jgi:tetratricopeptide (TPR) repeat protein
MTTARVFFLWLFLVGTNGQALDLITYRGQGFTLQYPKKHSRLLPRSAAVAFSLEYRKCFFRIETEKLLQPIDLDDPALAQIFMEVQLGELRERVGNEIDSHQIRRFHWGKAIELTYSLPAWNGKDRERDRVVEVLVTHGSHLFRLVYWVPEKELEKYGPVMDTVLENFQPEPVGVAVETLTSMPNVETKADADALRSYRALIESDPDRIEARFRLAVLLRKNGRPDEAIHHYLQILERDPEQPRVYYNLAVVHLEDKNEPGRAEDYFRRFLELDPESEKASRVTDWLQSRGR